MSCIYLEYKKAYIKLLVFIRFAIAYLYFLAHIELAGIYCLLLSRNMLLFLIRETKTEILEKLFHTQKLVKSTKKYLIPRQHEHE